MAVSAEDTTGELNTKLREFFKGRGSAINVADFAYVNGATLGVPAPLTSARPPLSQQPHLCTPSTGSPRRAQPLHH